MPTDHSNEGSGVPADSLYYNDPNHDPYTFIKTEKFYKSINTFNRPRSVDLAAGPGSSDATETGAVFRFNDSTLLLVQFVRPKVWKLRFDSKYRDPQEYDDFNTRTVICDTLKQLRDSLDNFEHLHWSVQLTEVPQPDPELPNAPSKTHFSLKSVTYESEEDKVSDTNGTVCVNILIEKAEFHMTAVRQIEPVPLRDRANIASLVGSRKTMLTHAGDIHKYRPWRIIWESVKRPLRWQRFGETTATVLSIVKPGSAKYIGFGEQGGKSLLKKSTFMNYFDYDNMMYNGVYGEGPLDEREPLYHSEPFWMELNAHQNMRSKVGTFIDNYSQICIDFGETNNSKIRIGTRFGPLDYYAIAGDDIPEIIKLYTSIIGRPKLKPRYILGHHQGCYGYDTEAKVLEKARLYRERKYPLDGIHIDVDLQDEYRTFTTSPVNFPNAAQMFSTLKDMHIKCSTNITPVIKNKDSAQGYKTFQEGMANNYFVKDCRKTNGFVENGEVQAWDVAPTDVRYIKYEGGTRIRMDPSPEAIKQLADNKQMYYDPGYDIKDNYNKGVEFHGGVYYGGDLGTPGFYPDLNRKEVRVWWGNQYKDLFDKGLEFVWQDMTSPCVAPSYGDMKGLPFRLLVSSDAWCKDTSAKDEKLTTIEIWSLYSYNLHKATYKGLNRLESRTGKRNFIIGRGSFAGMHRYAGLWTGDNASTWDHFKISVAQVLASSMSGVTVTGADVGGFMPDAQGNVYADPELLIRWYLAYSMLPWFRNHYHGKPGMKYFQEPFVYTDHYWSHQDVLGPQKWLYLSVEPVTKYYVQLRYTLLQLLYDTMFDNLKTGLPIARALCVSNPHDEALYTDAVDYLHDEYTIGQDLLCAPIMTRQTDENGSLEPQSRPVGKREVYLPQPDDWYPLNLRPGVDGYQHEPLKASIDGGSTIMWDGAINNDPAHIPYINPMFVREGGIIPQIKYREFIARPDDNCDPLPITIHVYPGKSNTYNMYLDDGVSRASAPSNLLADTTRAHVLACKTHTQNTPAASSSTISSLFTTAKDTLRSSEEDVKEALLDDQGKDEYTHIRIAQTWEKQPPGIKLTGSRTVSLENVHRGYDEASLKKDVGETMTVVLWHAVEVDVAKVTVEVTGLQGQEKIESDERSRCTRVVVPVGLGDGKVEIKCAFGYKKK